MIVEYIFKRNFSFFETQVSSFKRPLLSTIDVIKSIRLITVFLVLHIELLNLVNGITAKLITGLLVLLHIGLLYLINHITATTTII